MAQNVEVRVDRAVVMEGVLDANDALARLNRDAFDRAGVYALNMMSSPGAGKTTILERTLERAAGRLRIGVLEGDIHTRLDADRLQRFGAPVVQINTSAGFGDACHLDANMVRYGMQRLPPDALEALDVLVIENVGNLICPADFQTGEHGRVIVTSVTEGEDKPLKYPLMFRSADLVLINKVDLLPHLDFDMDRFERAIAAVNPTAPRLRLSARTGEGVAEWLDWLAARAAEHPTPC